MNLIGLKIKLSCEHEGGNNRNDSEQKTERTKLPVSSTELPCLYFRKKERKLILPSTQEARNISMKRYPNLWNHEGVNFYRDRRQT